MHSGVNENVRWSIASRVAQLAHAPATINNKIFGGTADVGKCVSLAVFHEAGEVITGDLPRPLSISITR